MSTGQRIEWRLSTGTMQRFRELLLETESVREGSDRHYALLDDIRALPGFPRHADPERDLIHFNVTTERTH